MNAAGIAVFCRITGPTGPMGLIGPMGPMGYVRRRNATAWPGGGARRGAFFPACMAVNRG